MDEDDRESTRRAWRFAQRYKSQYAPGFMAGWDIGRAAMLARWGCYLGWITESEAVGILWDLSQKVVEELHSWREFAQSYLFGGLMWKLLCGDSSAGSYLGYIADAATDLLTGKAEQDSGQWRDCPLACTEKNRLHIVNPLKITVIHQPPTETAYKNVGLAAMRKRRKEN